MHSLTLIALTFPAQLYPHLPSEQFCEKCYNVANEDRCQIVQQYDLLEGWNRSCFLQRRIEAERLCAIWFAAWWVRWKQANEEQQIEWADVLAGHIGADAFWRGEIPMPLSMR